MKVVYKMFTQLLKIEETQNAWRYIRGKSFQTCNSFYYKHIHASAHEKFILAQMEKKMQFDKQHKS